MQPCTVRLAQGLGSKSPKPTHLLALNLPYHTLWSLMGKSTISTGPFSSSQTVNVYQRVHESLANFHNIFLFAIILCDWLGWFTIWSPWKIPMSASSSVHMSFSRRDSLQRSTAVRALFTFDSVGARNYSQLFLVYPSLFLQHLGVWHLVYF